MVESHESLNRYIVTRMNSIMYEISRTTTQNSCKECLVRNWARTAPKGDMTDYSTGILFRMEKATH